MKIAYRLLFIVLISANLVASEYKLLTGSVGGNWNNLGEEIALAANKNGIKMKDYKGGGVSNILKINSSEADIGFSVGSLVGASLGGDELFSKKIDNVNVLANLYPQITYFIARKDFAKKHNIKSLQDAIDYKKLRMATLGEGTSSRFVVKSLLKLGYNKTFLDIKKSGKVEYCTYKEGAKLLKDNKIDMFAFSVGEKAKIVKKIESETDVIILPIEKNALAKLSRHYGTRTYILKPKAYKSIKKFTPTIGDFTVLIARKDLPEKFIRNVARVLLGNKNKLTNRVSDFSSFNARTAITTTLPMNNISRSFFSSKR